MATVQLLLAGGRHGFPDRIQRTVAVAHPPEKVWAALTTAGGLVRRRGDDRPAPGRGGRMRRNEEGITAEMRVERVEESAVSGSPGVL